MKTPDRIAVSPTSLPHSTLGHGVVVTFYSSKGYDSDVFIDRETAVYLRDLIDEALEKGADRAAG